MQVGQPPNKTEDPFTGTVDEQIVVAADGPRTNGELSVTQHGVKVIVIPLSGSRLLTLYWLHDIDGRVAVGVGVFVGVFVGVGVTVGVVVFVGVTVGVKVFVGVGVFVFVGVKVGVFVGVGVGVRVGQV